MFLIEDMVPEWSSYTSFNPLLVGALDRARLFPEVSFLTMPLAIDYIEPNAAYSHLWNLIILPEINIHYVLSCLGSYGLFIRFNRIMGDSLCIDLLEKCKKAKLTISVPLREDDFSGDLQETARWLRGIEMLLESCMKNGRFFHEIFEILYFTLVLKSMEESRKVPKELYNRVSSKWYEAKGLEFLKTESGLGKEAIDTYLDLKEALETVTQNPRLQLSYLHFIAWSVADIPITPILASPGFCEVLRQNVSENDSAYNIKSALIKSIEIVKEIGNRALKQWPVPPFPLESSNSYLRNYSRKMHLAVGFKEFMQSFLGYSIDNVNYRRDVRNAIVNGMPDINIYLKRAYQVSGLIDELLDLKLFHRELFPSFLGTIVKGVKKVATREIVGSVKTLVFHNRIFNSHSYIILWGIKKQIVHGIKKDVLEKEGRITCVLKDFKNICKNRVCCSGVQNQRYCYMKKSTKDIKFEYLH